MGQSRAGTAFNSMHRGILGTLLIVAFGCRRPYLAVSARLYSLVDFSGVDTATAAALEKQEDARRKTSERPTSLATSASVRERYDSTRIPGEYAVNR